MRESWSSDGANDSIHHRAPRSDVLGHPIGSLDRERASGAAEDGVYCAVASSAPIAQCSFCVDQFGESASERGARNPRCRANALIGGDDHVARSLSVHPR
jgi:hypothetical protein